MKKILTIALTFCAFIAAMACGSNDPEVDGTTGATEQTGGEGEGTAKGKMLVIYFSRADENWQVGYVERGNTAIMEYKSETETNTSKDKLWRLLN